MTDDAKYIIDNVLDLVRPRPLPPEVWFSDRFLDRATWVSPVTGRHEGEPCATVELVAPGDSECMREFKITLRLPLRKGWTRPHTAVYLLDFRNFSPNPEHLVRGRWPD